MMSTLSANAVEFGGFWFTAWPAPDRIAFAADSDEALKFLTPRIGPSSVVVLHRVSRSLRDERLVWWDLRELAHACGLGHADKIRSTGLLVRTLGRLQHFAYLRQPVGYPQVCEIRTQIPPLSRRDVEHLPAGLQAEAPSV
jgi:hypothetical protein